MFQKRVRLLEYGFAESLSAENIRRCFNFFLNGFSVWELLATDFFYRIGKYLGHGLCYEVAALLMLVYRDYPEETRLVFADCMMDDGERTDHAWFEFKAHHLWWAIDPAWYAPTPRLRIMHKLMARARYERVIGNDEFWGNKLAQQFYQALKKPETSYLFYELSLFRRIPDEISMTFEHLNISDLRNSGKQPDLRLMNVYSEQYEAS